MNVAAIIAEIDGEISRLEQARAVLAGLGPETKLAPASSGESATKPKRGRRKMSAEARARIGAATKARWAAKASAGQG